ncbi:MAG: hypothetical protein V4578_09240 [Pseudomonadota bacterium]
MRLQALLQQRNGRWRQVLVRFGQPWIGATDLVQAARVQRIKTALTDDGDEMMGQVSPQRRAGFGHARRVAQHRALDLPVPLRVDQGHHPVKLFDTAVRVPVASAGDSG